MPGRRNRIKNGFTLLELLVVVAVISIVVIMAGSLSSVFALRRDVDDVSYRIASTLNLVKLQALREGVEFRAQFTYNSENNTLSITTFRGDSNRNSSIFTQLATQQISLINDYEMTPTTTSIEFNPNFTAGGAGSIQIKPISDSSTKVKKCGNIVVSPFGRIRTIIGNWDTGSEECKPIIDEQEI